ncbi:hypothetical protein LINGRAPRIM_LOCUS3128 [Linum grandiflorum]
MTMMMMVVAVAVEEWPLELRQYTRHSFANEKMEGGRELLLRPLDSLFGDMIKPHSLDKIQPKSTTTAAAKPKLPNFSVLLRSKIPQSHQILSLKSASSFLAASISFAAMAPPSPYPSPYPSTHLTLSP